MPDTIQLSSIIIGERFRKDYGDMDKLIKSIQTFGLLQPVVVSRTFELLAGGRRINALKALNWQEIPIVYIDEVDDYLHRQIELEENLARKNLTWQEEALLTLEIHNLYTKKYGQATTAAGASSVPLKELDVQDTGWSIRRTADLMHTSHMSVYRGLQSAKALEVLPSLANETSQSNALKKLDRLIEDVENEIERRTRDKNQLNLVESSIICGDSTSLILDLPAESVDCIITDPPYGVDVGQGGGHRTEALFDDSPESMLATLRSIAPQLRRVLKPSGHLYVFFSPKFWQPVIDIYRSAGFDIRDVPCIWNKPGGATGTTDWDHNFAPSWEPFLFASNRSQRLAFKRKDVFTYAVDLGASRKHPTQKPIELIRELIQLSTNEGDLIFDPFLGGGTTAVAASQLRRRYLGYELDPHYHSIAIKRVFDEGKDRPFVKREEL